MGPLRTCALLPEDRSALESPIVGLSALDRDQDSAFSRARNARFRDSNIFRSVFERVVGACLGAGLVGGEGFAVDANLIVADANKEQSIPGSEWSKERDAQEVGRAAKEYLATPDDAASAPGWQNLYDDAQGRAGASISPPAGRFDCDVESEMQPTAVIPAKIEPPAQPLSLLRLLRAVSGYWGRECH